MGRIRKAHTVEVAHGDATDQIDDGDDDPRLGVPPDKLTGTIHRPVKLTLFDDLSASLVGLGFRDDAGIQVGINGHLFSRHRVQRKSSRHFTDPLGTLGDHNELDDHQNQKDHQSDHEAATRHKPTKGINKVACLPVQEDESG